MPGTTLSEFHPFRSAEARDRYLADYDRRAAEWPVPSETLTVHVEQGDTFVRISGPVDGPPLVVLSGIWSDSLMWPPTMIAAFAQRHRVYLLDNPWDLGRSVNTRATTSRTDYVAWLGGTLDELGLRDDVNVLGLSLGVWIAAEYALTDPGRFAKMVWMSPGGVVCSAYRLSTIPDVPKMLRVMSAPSKATVGALMDRLMADAARSPDPAVRQEHEEYVEAVALGLQCFTKRPIARETNRRFSDRELSALPMPVLYLAGENELFGPPSKVVTRLAAAAPMIRTVVVRDCGHELMSLRADEATARTLEFLDA